MKKQTRSIIRNTVLVLALLWGTDTALRGQSDPGLPRPTPVNPAFAFIPGASEIISNILATPAPTQSVSAVSAVASGPFGNFWSLQRTNWPPLPFNPFPELPFYQLDPTNQIYVYDDRGVDYPALEQERQAEALTNGVATPLDGPVMTPLDLSGYTGLWLEIPAGGVNESNLTVIVHNTSDGQAYTALTKEALTDSAWAEEQLFYGTNGDSTTIQLQTNGRTNLFVWARTGVPASTLAILSQPLDQDVLEGDTVTFSVVATGGGTLTYQWTCSGTNIPSATASSYTINNVQDSDAAGYAVTVSNGVTSVTSRTAQLTVELGTGDPLLMVVQGPRQDYSFKNGVTYYVGSAVELYGTTTLRGGSVIKLDWNTTNSSLVVKGALVCHTQPYFPAILTSVDDDSQGEWLYWVSTGYPQPANNGVAYLNLDAASSNVISNLRICFADQGVTTPVSFRELDVWDCQFYQCNTAIANQVWGFGPRDILHNVLFAQCGAAIGASTNSVEIEAEHVTADVTNFWTAPTPPYKIALTNSIILGTFGSSSIVITQNTVVNPAGTVFQSASLGNYYLSATSPLHRAGTPSISPRLMAEFQQKSTYPPILLAPYLQISGNMTLFPQAPRYTSGPPDMGFWYDALDYSVATLIQAGGALTVEPGTAIGIRNEYVPTYDSFTSVGFWIEQGSSFVSHGTPAKPNVLTATKLVQEMPATDFSQYQLYWGLPFGIISLVSDWEDDGSGSQAPTFDFRFSSFYLPPQDYHYWSGLSEDGNWITSPDSSVYWSMQDCSVRGGRINLGEPDYYDFPADYLFAPGAVSWINNLFDRVNINLDPTLYEYGVDDLGLNCDVALQAHNNLFRGGDWFVLQPIPASAGNWVFEDNLFDKVDFIQDTASPLDFDYNGYWPKLASELLWSGSDASQLLPTTTGDGFTDAANEKVLPSAPLYQIGPFGNFYLPTNTALYGAGSRTPANAGLYHYTTRLDQVKEGSEPAGHNVNIGVHYVAANNYGLPMDSDGDGIPDYVEDANGNGLWDQGIETDWQHNYSTLGPDGTNYVADAYSPVYDDIDLDGDGLTGRAERILGKNPLVQDNPLVLAPVITGQEPFVLTYSVSLGADLDTNQCMLDILDNGVPGTDVELSPQGGNTYQLQWCTTFGSYGTHLLQAEFSMPGASASRGDPPGPVTRVFGPLRVENVTNIVQFDPASTSFGSQISIYGTLQVPVADYTISIYDTTNNLVETITNHTDTGEIDETWDLTTDGGQLRNDQEFTASVQVSPIPPLNPPPPAVPLNFWRSGTVIGDQFEIAYGWDSQVYNYYRKNMIGCVVDTVFNPSLDNAYQNTMLNCFTCDPFFMYYSGDGQTILLSLNNILVQNFFFCGHGTFQSFGSVGTRNDPSLASVSTADLQTWLGNGYYNHAFQRPHPFRLVIMDSCNSANTGILAQKFGFPYPATLTKQWYDRRGEEPQAFVGFKEEIWLPTGASFLPYVYHGDHLADMFGLWMSEVPLVQCVAAGATPYGVIGDCPLDPSWTIFGDPYLTRTPSSHP